MSGLTYQVDPVTDDRWASFVQRHPDASVFHTPEWLGALRRTYGYEPVVFTTTPPGRQLTNGLVFCQIESWLTGRRLVSLPFSDHCQPLVESEDDFSDLLRAATQYGDDEKCKYAELRPLSLAKGVAPGFEASQGFCYHRLDLLASRDELFRSLHKSSVQRKICRAQREGLTIERGRSEILLSQFYSLLLRTRRRHRLPPQPRTWFENLIASFGETLKIWVACVGSCPIASILTISFRDTLVYKNGCSDERFHDRGGMQLLLWTAIEEAQQHGCRTVDLGRSDLDNPGLIAFKDHWGAARSQMTYLRWSRRGASLATRGWKTRVAQQTLARLSDGLLTTAGNLLYRHMG
jgi:hypothetical protein